MNLTLGYLVLLIGIIIFFLLFYIQYLSYYKKKQQIDTFKCATNVDDFFVLEVDNEIQACFNHIKDYSVNMGYQLFDFNGKKSYVYIDDFLDNLFYLELKVKFNFVTITPQGISKTLLHTKFLKVYVLNQKLQVEYKYNDILKNKIFSNIKLDTYKVYILKIVQTKETITVFFDDFGKLEEEVSKSYLAFNTLTEQRCDFSSGNDIYIGCNRNKITEFINASIGEIKLKINKRKYDDYILIGDTIPLDLTCKDQHDEYNTTDQNTPAQQTNLTRRVLDNFNKTGNNIQIYLSNVLNDIKIKYLTLPSSEEDKIYVLNRERIAKINDIYSKLVAKEELFTNSNRYILEKTYSNKYFNDGYNNLNDKKDFIMYLFNLKSFRNQSIIEKFKFLDLNTVKRRYINFTNVYILIFGKKTGANSYFRFLKLQRPVFFIIYKNNNSNSDEGYFYEQVSINLNLFYEFHKQYLIHIMNNKSIEEDTLFESFINSLESGISLNIDNQLDKLMYDNNPIEYSKNFFRMYDTELNYGISASIYENTELDKTIFINYKDKTVREQCKFIPYGETVFDCINECNNSNYFACGDNECKNLCNNCNSEECKWNLVDIEKMNKFKPSICKIKGFAGDRQIKLTWIKPLSSYPIEKYYIILENIQSEQRFDMYVYDGEEQLIEYVISNLQNNTPYKFYVFSKNSSGISDVSNSVTIIPQKNKIMEVKSENVNSFSDSLQNYNRIYNSRGYDDENFKIDNRVIALQNLQELNELQNVLIEKITENNNSNNLNINIY